MGKKLSLAVAAKGQCDPQPFLDALLADGITQSPDIDIHIAHDSIWPLTLDNLSDNVTLHACPLGTSILKLWGKAISASTGDYAAVLDIYCQPAVGWLDSVLQEIKKGSVVFCGPVNPGWQRNDPRIVGYLTEYAQFSRPLMETDEVPGNNIACLRYLFEKDEKLQTEGFFKTFMVWKLESEQNLIPVRVNSMLINYRKPFKTAHYIKRRFIHGRCFGATRHDNPGQPSRLVCLGFTVLLPFLRLWRIYKAVRDKNDLKWAFFRFLFLVVLSECAWSAGEFFGYAFGGKTYCDNLD